MTGCRNNGQSPLASCLFMIKSSLHCSRSSPPQSRSEKFSLLLLDKTSCTCFISLSTCDYWLTTSVSWVLSDSHDLFTTNNSDWCLCCCTTDDFNARQNMSDNPSISTLSYVAWYKNEISVSTSCSDLFIDPFFLSFRLYSDYLYFGIANKSAEDFHEKVSESLQLFEGCLTEYTMRSCVYNTTVNNAMPVSVPLHRAFCLEQPRGSADFSDQQINWWEDRNRKGVRKNRWSEIHTSLAHAIACTTDLMKGIGNTVEPPSRAASRASLYLKT